MLRTTLHLFRVFVDDGLHILGELLYLQLGDEQPWEFYGWGRKPEGVQLLVLELEGVPSRITE